MSEIESTLNLPSRELVIQTHPQPAPSKAYFTTLSPELLLSILEYLPARDVFSLILVCKAFYPVAHQILWSTPLVLDTSHYQDIKLRYAASDSNPLYMGWTFIKDFLLLDIGTPQMPDEESARILIELFHSGKLEPRCIDIEIYGRERGEEGLRVHDQEFWKSLMEYCRSKPPGEISLTLHAHNFQIMSLIDFQHLVKFRLDYGYTNLVNEDSRIMNLTTILNTAVMLKDLSLISIWRPFEQDIHILEESPEVLAGFQQAFDKLVRLERLVIENLFKEKSFFLSPPSNLKYLQIKAMTTPSWWLQLSKCSIPKLETLIIHHQLTRQCWDDQEQWSKEEFRINSVAITTLTGFSGEGPVFGTSDFADCILAANKGLNGNHEFISKRGNQVVPSIQSFARVMKDTMHDILESKLSECTWENVGPLLRDRGVDFVTDIFARDCLRTLNADIYQFIEDGAIPL
ncbi:hypothetical protein TWF788_008003 [Orbilia oligospora]|uniref:F-box domain-containing protein n=1 Tax=Orbilia oligospora TaxID=2813651 RepID=A0A6G1LXU7_ORBOL|nr:hypothetical protein TWF788_008003 [Orbilia oligospora]KAF3201370.1 hypothetical protein TWF191_003429 [Orbilia oligospora]KAF3237784.1 hypothetical protein TWF192_010787 [Orbilia oligospora]